MRRSIPASLLAMAFGAGVAPSGVPANAAIFTTGPQSGGESGGNVCMDVRFANPAPGAPIGAVGCNASLAEQFEMIGSTIFAVGGARCVNISGDGIAVRSVITSAKCDGAAAQDWVYVSGQIVNPPSGLCLDSGSSSGVGQLFVNRCNGSDTQQWQIK